MYVCIAYINVYTFMRVCVNGNWFRQATTALHFATPPLPTKVARANATSAEKLASGGLESFMHICLVGWLSILHPPKSNSIVINSSRGMADSCTQALISHICNRCQDHVWKLKLNAFKIQVVLMILDIFEILLLLLFFAYFMRLFLIFPPSPRGAADPMISVFWWYSRAAVKFRH